MLYCLHLKIAGIDYFLMVGERCHCMKCLTLLCTTIFLSRISRFYPIVLIQFYWCTVLQGRLKVTLQGSYRNCVVAFVCWHHICTVMDAHRNAGTIVCLSIGMMWKI